MTDKNAVDGSIWGSLFVYISTNIDWALFIGTLIGVGALFLRYLEWSQSKTRNAELKRANDLKQRELDGVRNDASNPTD